MEGNYRENEKSRIRGQGKLGNLIRKIGNIEKTGKLENRKFQTKRGNKGNREKCGKYGKLRNSGIL